MEEQFILRVPPKVAEQIRKILRSKESIPLNIGKEDASKKKEDANQGQNMQDLNMDISFDEDRRSAIFQMGMDEYIATLVDLPCVIEAQKTYDNVNYYKSGDIGQIMVVHDPSEEEEDGDGQLPYDSEFKMNSGITPPTRNIRKRKFRKVDEQRKKAITEVEPEIVKIMRGGSLAEENIELVQPFEEDGESLLAEGSTSATSPLPPTPSSTASTPAQPTPQLDEEQLKILRKKEKKREKKEKKKKKKEKRESAQTSPSLVINIPVKTPQSPSSPFSPSSVTLSRQTSPTVSPLTSPAIALYSPVHTPHEAYSPAQPTPSPALDVLPQLSPATATPTLTPLTAMSPQPEFRASQDEEEILEIGGTIESMLSEGAMDSYKTNPVYLQLQEDEKTLQMEISSLEQRAYELRDKVNSAVNKVQKERFDARRKQTEDQIAEKKEKLDSVRNELSRFES